MGLCLFSFEGCVIPVLLMYFAHVSVSTQAKNRAGQVGYVPEKYLQLPSSNSLMSMLQSLAALDTRSHSSSTSTEQEPELTNLVPNTVPNGDSSGMG